MALTISEQWIRERVQLKHDNLEDVRSLALPGTYHEKISSINNALKNFNRLKNLDLSRNTIELLEGLQHLKLLEKLNLYYNNIGNLSELSRLRHNPRLQELDLRLNPVARNEPDYRLYLIHMLPNLRRLDDRAVRDSERRAALMHFTTDQAAAMTEHLSEPEPQPQVPNPRAEQIRKMARPGVLEADDMEVLDLIARAGHKLPASSDMITGSTMKQPAVEDYPTQYVHQMDRVAAHTESGTFAQPLTWFQRKVLELKGNNTFKHAFVPPLDLSKLDDPYSKTQSESQPMKDYTASEDLASRYPNIAALAADPSTETNGQPGKSNMAQGTLMKKNHRVQFAKETKTQTYDPNLKYVDENEAYMAFKATGNFTPNPELTMATAELKAQEPPVVAQQQQVAPQAPTEPPGDSLWDQHSSPAVELYSSGPEPIPQDLPEEKSLPDPAVLMSAPESLPSYTRSTGNANDEEAERLLSMLEHRNVIMQISGLADKYWNGSKSLLKNKRFLNQASNLFSGEQTGQNFQPTMMMSNPESEALQHEITRLRNELAVVRQENAELNGRLQVQPLDFESTDDSKLKSSVIRAQRDLSILRGRLQKTMEENRALQDQLEMAKTRESSIVNTSCITPAQLENINEENSKLRQEIQLLNVKLKQSSQMQELAGMLQESHKSLVQTNDHLLKEMNELRQRSQHSQHPLVYGQVRKPAQPSYAPHNGMT